MSHKQKLNAIIALKSQGMTKEALDACQRLLQDFPNENATRYLLALLLEEDQRLAEAHLKYEEAHAKEPHNVAILTRKANIEKKCSLWQEASQSYDKLFALQPGQFSHRIEQANLLAQAKRYDEADRIYESMAPIIPKDTGLWINWGNIDRERGNFKAAAEKYQRAISIKAHPAAHNNTGLCHLHWKQYPQAKQAFEKALSLHSEYVEPYYNLGVLYLEQSKGKRAIRYFRKAIALRPTFKAAYPKIASVHLRAGQHEKAMAILSDGLRILPDDPDIQCEIAMLHLHQQDAARAEVELKRLVHQYPKHLPSLCNLGQLYETQSRFEKAIDLYQKALSISATHLPAQLGLGNAYRLQGWSHRALKQYQQANQSHPQNSSVLNNLGLAHKDIGKRDVSQAFFLEALSQTPTHTGIYYHLASVHSFEHQSDPILQKMLALVDQKRDDVPLQFALGKAYEDIGLYSQAQSHLQTANRLLRQRYAFDIESECRSVLALREIPYIPYPSLRANDSPTPIFILGMPRSGSTLLEQMLGAHSAIQAAGERPFLPKLLRDTRPQTSGYSEDQYRYIANAYRDSLRTYGPTTPFICDKLPQNFRNIGHIRCALPSAVIVHIYRNPLDCCLSIFKHYFPQSLPFANDPAELAQYFVAYQALMQHWSNTYGGSIIHVRYEDLVTNPQEELQRILQPCNLDFESSQLRYYQNPNSVNTASSLQVRQPLYRRSIASWKRFPDVAQQLLTNPVFQNHVNLIFT